MTDAEYRKALALFRYGLIAEFVHLPAGSRGLYTRLREKARHEHTIPGSTRTRVAAETLRHWLSEYRRGGFDALLPKGRSDRGRPRALPQAVADALLTLKDEQPGLSIPQLIRAALDSGAAPADLHIPPSTVHRLLSRAGLMHKQSPEQNAQDRRRFAFAHAGELWMSDVMHGPSVALPGRGRRKCYLIAFLDDATRVVPYCAFTLSENTAAFLPVFKQALMRRGIPQRLYVDNGANFRSQHLALVCAKLGIALIHARPYQPQGKGKMERWFRTARSQLVNRLSSADTESLQALNRRLWAWVEGEYHQAPHRGLEEQTPLDRWAMSADQVRLPGPHIDLDSLFLIEVKR
jgi:putative transposase